MEHLTWNITTLCLCTDTFRLDQPFENNVLMYYGLSNFYQSHRCNLSSRDDSQLNGDLAALKNPNKVCESYNTSNGLPIAPCGAVANSLCNETLGCITLIMAPETQLLWWRRVLHGGQTSARNSGTPVETKILLLLPRYDQINQLEENSLWAGPIRPREQRLD